MLVQRVVRPSVHARRFQYRAFECGRWFWQSRFGGGPIDSPGTDPPNSTRPGAERSSGLASVCVRGPQCRWADLLLLGGMDRWGGS